MTTKGTAERAGQAALVAVAAAWAVCLARILRHRIYVSLDSLISYAHVWYVSDRLWHHARIPLAMPVLGHGKALAFPYGFVPWTSAALLRPLLGDWVVTLWLVVGVILLMATTFLAFPELRRGWWAAAVLLNPALLAAAFIGQLPFTWAAAALFAGIACWRRGRLGLATAFVALAQLTHPAVLCPIVLVLVGWRVLLHGERALVRPYLVSVVVALPAIAMVVLSPVFGDTSLLTKAWGFTNTVFPRSLAVAVPLLLVWVFRRRPQAAVGACALAAVLALDVAVWGPLNLSIAWRGMRRQPSVAMQPFLRSDTFRPGATYRILRSADKRVGLYQLIRAGGRSDAEFFPESELRKSWRSLEVYSTLLHDHHVDAVMVWSSYEREHHTNERRLLDELTSRDCRPPLACMNLVAANDEYRLYERRGMVVTVTAPT